MKQIWKRGKPQQVCVSQLMTLLHVNNARKLNWAFFLSGSDSFFSREYFNCIPAQPWLLKKSKIHYDIEIYYDIDHTPQ